MRPLTIMTSHRSACFCLFLSSFGIACSGQTFGVGGFPASDAGEDAGSATLPIDPIAKGNSWTYDVTVAGTYPDCVTGSGTATVGAESTIDGKDAFLVSSFCPGIAAVEYSTDGDVVYAYNGQTWLLALDSPVQDGHAWTNSIEMFVWKQIGTITVGAGTFDNCFEADVQDEANYYAVTFCRGIGPVKWHFRDTTGQNGYDAVLTAKNIN